MNEENVYETPIEMLERQFEALTAINVMDNETISKFKGYIEDAEHRISNRNELRELLQTALDTLNGV